MFCLSTRSLQMSGADKYYCFVRWMRRKKNWTNERGEMYLAKNVYTTHTLYLNILLRKKDKQTLNGKMIEKCRWSLVKLITPNRSIYNCFVKRNRIDWRQFIHSIRTNRPTELPNKTQTSMNAKKEIEKQIELPKEREEHGEKARSGENSK